MIIAILQIIWYGFILGTAFGIYICCKILWELDHTILCIINVAGLISWLILTVYVLPMVVFGIEVGIEKEES